MKKKIGLFVLLGIVMAASIAATESQLKAGACSEQCNTTADCTTGCIRTYKPWPVKWVCVKVKAHSSPGKVCGNAESGTCLNDDEVNCGATGYQSCDDGVDCSQIDSWTTATTNGCV